jgi:hypothetical protein
MSESPEQRRSVQKTLNFSPVPTQFTPEKDSNDHLVRNIPLIYSNLVQFEGFSRKQHRAQSQKIRDNPGSYRVSTTSASALTLSETLYLAQVLEMWAHMSKDHRDLFVEMVVVESSIVRIDKLRSTCDMKDSRAILKQDVEYYELSDEELDKKIVFIRNQTDDEIRSLMTTSVKYQGYFQSIKPFYSIVDKLTCGYAFAFLFVIVLSTVGWLFWIVFYSIWKRY